MSLTQVLPVASAIVILLFAALVFRRYARRGGTHLLVWGIGLTMFGIGSLAEAYSALAWNPVLFRLWYLTGAVLNAAWLGQGTVYLLSGQRLSNLLIALALGYAVATVVVLILAAPLALSRGIVASVIAIGGIVGTVLLQRAWIRRWNPQRLTGALMVVLLVGSLAAAYFVFAIPLDAKRFDRTQTLSAQYREILPAGTTIRKLTPVFNIYGTLTLVGGALYSAWLLWRKEIVPNRVVGNILIALGALAIASASTLVRLGLGDYLYLGELAAAVLMFVGFLLATARGPAPPVAAEVSRR